MGTDIIKTVNYFSATEDIEIDPSKTVLWVGAGLSYGAPSNLPLGNALTDAYLCACLGDDYSKRFIEYWNRHIEPLKDVVKQGEVGPISEVRKKCLEGMDGHPRLEFVIGELSKLDDEFSDFRFHCQENNDLFERHSNIEALRHFAEAEPNYGHRTIAEFADTGAVIVTTNFDVCIEKAIGATHLDLNTPVIRDGVQGIQCDNGSFVYHIHGVATDENIKQNLGTTINKVSQPLPDDFKKKIISLFDEGYDILFIGYSGSDYFDVKPFFDELVGVYRFTGRALFLNHCNSKDDLGRVQKDKRHIYLLKPFYEKIEIFGRTEDFLKDVIDKCKGCRDNIDPFSEMSVKTESNPKVIDNNGAFYETKKELSDLAYDKPIGRRDYYQFLNLFRLCAQLNINPGNIEKHWAEKIADIYNRWESDGEDTVDRMYSKGPVNDLVLEDIAYNNWKSKNRIYCVAAKKAFSHRTETVSRAKIKLNKYMGRYLSSPPTDMIDFYVEETCRILKKGISDAHEADICRGTMMFFYSRNIKRLFFLWEKIPILRGWCEKEMKKLLPYYDRLLRFNFTRFQYRTHYLYPYRFRNVLHAILGDVAPNDMGLYGDIQHEWDICMESSDLFDARRIMENRIEQIQVLRKRGIYIDANAERNIKEVLVALTTVLKDL